MLVYVVSNYTHVIDTHVSAPLCGFSDEQLHLVQTNTAGLDRIVAQFHPQRCLRIGGCLAENGLDLLEKIRLVRCNGVYFRQVRHYVSHTVVLLNLMRELLLLDFECPLLSIYTLEGELLAFEGRTEYLYLLLVRRFLRTQLHFDLALGILQFLYRLLLRFLEFGSQPIANR